MSLQQPSPLTVREKAIDLTAEAEALLLLMDQSVEWKNQMVGDAAQLLAESGETLHLARALHECAQAIMCLVDRLGVRANALTAQSAAARGQQESGRGSS